MIHRISRPSRPEFRPDTLGVRAVLFTLVLGFMGVGCTPVAVDTAEPVPAVSTVPAIEPGTMPAEASEEARRALALARRHREDGAWELAREVARDVVARYPTAAGSGEALSILAEAEMRLGDPQAAREASERYLALFTADHPSFPGAILLRSRTLSEGGDPEGAFATLLRMPLEAPEDVRREADPILRELIRQVSTEAAARMVEEGKPRSAFRGIAATELALTLFLEGEQDEGRSWARRALLEPISAEDEALARGILSGNLESVLGEAIVLGAVLPGTGVSPGLQEYGTLVLEGIQVAVDEYQAALRRPIRLEVVDHQGEVDRVTSEVRALESMGAIGAVGPLTADFLQAAASGRTSAMPLVSPFSSLPFLGAEGVYSLSGPDPGGSEEVARYAWELGLERVAILRPGTGGAEVDAEAFRSVFEANGGTVSREVVFNPGATFFQAEFEEIGSLLPDGLFLPLSPRDVQLVAPQFTYFGLDTLGIQVLGTSGWTDEEVLADVDPRHTDGVIASTTRMSQDETDDYRRIRLRYEEQFQKTLRTNIPAFGYDAASLILQGLLDAPTAEGGLLGAIENTRDFPGATGHFSVSGGLVVRIPQLVRIQDRELIYISSHLH